MIGSGVFCLFSSASYLRYLLLHFANGQRVGGEQSGGFVGCRNKLLFGYYYGTSPDCVVLTSFNPIFIRTFILDQTLLLGHYFGCTFAVFYPTVDRPLNNLKVFLSISLSIAQLTWMELCGYGTLSRFNFIFISLFDCYSIRRKMLMKHTL
jgi:hypothetical protein